MFEDVDTQVPGSPPPEESDNRTFLIAAAILGGITLLSLICMAIYAIVVVPINRNRRATQEAEIAQQNIESTALALAAKTQTAEASIPTATSSPTVTTTPTASVTAVIAQATEDFRMLQPRRAQGRPLSRLCSLKLPSKRRLSNPR